eukprot:gene20352-25577_t
MLKPKVKQSKSKSKLRGSDSKMVYFDQSVPLLEKRAAEEALKPTGYHVCQFLDRHVGLLITCHREWEKYGARCTATGSSPTDHTSNISPAGLGPSPLEGDLA